MKFLVGIFAVLVASTLHSAFSASLQTAEKEEKTEYDGLTELQKTDQLEFEAAQKDEAIQINVEDPRYLVKVKSEDSSSEESEEVQVELLNDAEEGGPSSSNAAAAEKGATCQSAEVMLADEQQQKSSTTQPGRTLEDDRKHSTKEQDALQ
ncbi:uncharacterized protein LOC144210207 [Stigmatopora nigra]